MKFRLNLNWFHGRYILYIASFQSDLRFIGSDQNLYDIGIVRSYESHVGFILINVIVVSDQ